MEIDILGNLSPNKVLRIQEKIMEKCWTCKKQKYGVALRPRGDRQCKQCHEVNVAALKQMQVPSQSTHNDSLRLSTNVIETESMSPVNNEVITDTADDQNEDEKDILIDELLCFVSNKIDILPPTTIKQLCVSTFTEDDIEK